MIMKDKLFGLFGLPLVKPVGDSQGPVDLSSHSTFAAESAVDASHKLYQGRPKKSVDFSESVQLGLYVEDEGDGDGDDHSWYSSDDIKRFRQELNEAANIVLRRKPEFQRTLAGVFLGNSEFLSPNQQRCLVKALQKDRIGLEDLGIQSRHERKQQILCATMRHSSDPEKLRKACESLSKPCRLYARHIATAHAENVSNRYSQ